MGFIVRDFNPDSISSLRKDTVGSAQTSTATFVCVGDAIDVDSEDNYLRGHGTNVVNGQLVASVCGIVQRVNKLILVRPVKERYTASQGDVVVGRVIEIVGKKWKVHLNSQHEASLQLSAVTLAGGVQRRRTAEDERDMRQVFKEGDLISAEVQSVHSSDKSVNLHTRSSKWCGKLEGGQLVMVPPNLVKRQKQHNHHLHDLDVDLILGVNGMLWVAPHIERPPAPSSSEDPPQTAPPPPTISKDHRERAVRVAGAIRALERLYIPIYATSILETYKLSVDNRVPIRDMLERTFLTLLAQREAARRDAAAN